MWVYDGRDQADGACSWLQIAIDCPAHNAPMDCLVSRPNGACVSAWSDDTAYSDEEAANIEFCPVLNQATQAAQSPGKSLKGLAMGLETSHEATMPLRGSVCKEADTSILSLDQPNSTPSFCEGADTDRHLHRITMPVLTTNPADMTTDVQRATLTACEVIKIISRPRWPPD